MRKKITIATLSIIILLTAFAVARAGEIRDPYITTQTTYTDETVACDWLDCHLVPGGNNHRYCTGECSGQWICENAIGESWADPGTKTVRKYSSTDYCNFISSVNVWSECVNGVQVAEDGEWSYVVGRTCSNVPLTQSCNDAPIAEITLPASDLTGSQSVAYKSLINFAGTGTDPEGDPIVGYEWCLGAPGCSSPISNSASFSYGNLPPATTSQVFFRVRDDQGDSHWSEADSVSVEVKPTCIDSSGNPTGAPAGAAFCSGDNEDLSANTTISQIGSSEECSAPKCQYYYLPVNGKIGDAKNQIFCQRPEENLCDEGDPSSVSVSSDGGFWEWTCKGRYGGTDKDGRAVKSCAYKEVNPN